MGGTSLGCKYSPWVKRRSVLRQGMLSVHLFPEWDYIKSYPAPVLRKPSTKRPSNSLPRRRGIYKLYEDSSKDTVNFKQARFRTLIQDQSKLYCVERTDHNRLQIKPWKECLYSDASEAAFLNMLFINKMFFWFCHQYLWDEKFTLRTSR